MIKEKLSDLGTGVIEVSWHLIIQSMRLGHRRSAQGLLAVYAKLDFDALKERIKLLIFSAWTGIKTIFHGDDRGTRTGTSSLRSLCAAELSNIPTTNNRWPQSHCLLHRRPSDSGLGPYTLPKEDNRTLPAEAEVKQAHSRSKELPAPASDSRDPRVCSVLTSVNGQILLEHYVVSSLEKWRGGEKSHNWVELPSRSNMWLWNLKTPSPARSRGQL